MIHASSPDFRERLVTSSPSVAMKCVALINDASGRIHSWLTPSCECTTPVGRGNQHGGGLLGFGVAIIVANESRDRDADFHPQSDAIATSK